MATHYATVDFVERNMMSTVHLVQGDKTLPTLEVACFVRNEDRIFITGDDVTLRIGKTDGTFVIVPRYYEREDSNIVDFIITEQCCTVAGDQMAVVEVNRGGFIEASSPILIRVDANPVTVDMVESMTEYPRIAEMVEASETAAATATTAAQNAESIVSRLSIDSTLTNEGQVAEAKAVGDALSLGTRIFPMERYGTISGVDGSYILDTPSSGNGISFKMAVKAGDIYSYNLDVSSSKLAIAAYTNKDSELADVSQSVLGVDGRNITGTYIVPDGITYIRFTSRNYKTATTIFCYKDRTGGMADRLSNTVAIGSSTKPIYFSSNGVPVVCDNDLLNPIFNILTANKIILPADNSKGIEPLLTNYGQIGTADKKFSRMYATTFYGDLQGEASRLSVNSVGNSKTPVYFSNGVPRICDMSHYGRQGLKLYEETYSYIEYVELVFGGPDDFTIIRTEEVNDIEFTITSIYPEDVGATYLILKFSEPFNSKAPTITATAIAGRSNGTDLNTIILGDPWGFNSNDISWVTMVESNCNVTYKYNEYWKATCNVAVPISKMSDVNHEYLLIPLFRFPLNFSIYFKITVN